VIAGFAVGYQLHNGEGDRGKQENMNKASLVKGKFQNKPNYQEQPTDNPHLRDAFLTIPGIE